MIKKQTATVYYSPVINRRFLSLRSAIRAEAKARVRTFSNHLEISGEFQDLLREAIKEIQEEHRINECYEKLDNRMSYRADKLIIAKKHGYNFISEAYEKMYYDDVPVKKIAKIFNICWHALYVVLRRNGVVMDKRGPKKKEAL